MTALAEMRQPVQDTWGWDVPIPGTQSWKMRYFTSRANYHLGNKKWYCISQNTAPSHTISSSMQLLNQCRLSARVQGETEPHVCTLDELLPVAEGGGGIPEAYTMSCM